MNREFLLEACIGITIGLLVVVLAAFRSAKAPKKGALRRGAMLGVVMYAVVAVPVFTPDGMTVVGAIGLMLVMALALVGSEVARRFDGGFRGPLISYLRMLVSTGMAAVLLIFAGQTLSLLAKVDPRVTVVAVAVVAGVIVAGQGLVASSRIGSMTMWFLIVPIALSVALGALLGSAKAVVAPIRVGASTPVLAIVAVALAILVLGFADASLAGSRRIGEWSPVRVLLWAVVVVALISVGLLMFLGGVVVAPSMEFFVVPSNMDAVPGLAGVLLAVLTILFVALVANALSGVAVVAAEVEAGGGPDDESGVAPKWVGAAAVVAGVVALVDVGAQSVLASVALIAASLVGAAMGGRSVERGAVAGVVAAVVSVIALVLMGQWRWDWGTAVALVLVWAVGFVVSRTGAPAGPAVGSETPAAAAPVAD